MTDQEMAAQDSEPGAAVAADTPNPAAIDPLPCPATADPLAINPEPIPEVAPEAPQPERLDRQEVSLIEQLQSAITGLIWQSETDAPFQVCSWSNPTGQILSPVLLLAKTNHDPDTPVKVVTLEEFCAPGLHLAGDSSNQPEKLQSLMTTITNNLSTIQVYRVGDIEIEIYIIGVDPEGNWVGVSTQSVET